jgi:hypothetical protein|tara:strand:+ start:115 stop:528 length:414 start_codon:yes stop_codon:yes gene_type:complete
MATTFSNDVVRIFRDTETLTAARTLTAADSGKTFWLDAAAGATITLPALKDGVNFKFVVADNFATTNWIIDSAEGDNIEGMIEVAGAVVVAAAEDQINFVASAEAKGDFIVLECNGTNWFVSGQAALSGGITATDPS